MTLFLSVLRPLSTLSIALLLGTLLFGCKKSDATQPAENTLSNYLTSENSLSTTVRTSGPWELGVVFSSSVAGKITQLGSKMPEPGSYRVIIWDVDTKQILRQKTVEQTSPDKLVLDNIDPLALVASKKYMISINSQSGGVNKKYSVAYKTGSSEFMPFSKGSMLIYYAAYTNTASAVFPVTVTNVKYEFYGYPEFTFIPD